jgi:hypothetical protein
MPRIPYAKAEGMTEETRAAVEKAPIDVMRIAAGALPAGFDADGEHGASTLASNQRGVKSVAL